ncbi:MAG: cytochrome c-type biogenesis CcmF C-terminal domain-containing protein, partial [Pseudomonadota bacterium]
SLMRWRSDDPARLWRISRITLAISVVIGLLAPVLIFGMEGIFVFPGIAAAVWITSGVVQSLRTASGGDWRRLTKLPQQVYAMNVAHLGMAVFAVGVTLVNAFEIEKDVRMAYGEPLEIGNQTFILETVEQIQGPNYVANRGSVKVLQGESEITTLMPEKRTYRVQQNPMTEAAIDPGLTRDIYVALGEPLSNNAWSMRVYYKPFIRWIWLGAILMALGGLLAVTDKRYRRSVKAAEVSATDGQAAA